jgi:hypothetical protein
MQCEVNFICIRPSPVVGGGVNQSRSNTVTWVGHGPPSSSHNFLVTWVGHGPPSSSHNFLVYNTPMSNFIGHTLFGNTPK